MSEEGAAGAAGPVDADGKVNVSDTEGGGVSCWDSDRKPADDGR